MFGFFLFQASSPTLTLISSKVSRPCDRNAVHSRCVFICALFVYIPIPILIFILLDFCCCFFVDHFSRWTHHFITLNHSHRSEFRIPFLFLLSLFFILSSDESIIPSENCLVSVWVQGRTITRQLRAMTRFIAANWLLSVCMNDIETWLSTCDRDGASVSNYSFRGENESTDLTAVTRRNRSFFFRFSLAPSRLLNGRRKRLKLRDVIIAKIFGRVSRAFLGSLTPDLAWASFLADERRRI